MKILLIAPPFLPVPAIRGGAIETLIDNFLKYNSKKGNLKITVYTPYVKELDNINLSNYNNTEFRCVKKDTIIYQMFRIKKFILKLLKFKQIPSSYSMYINHDLKNKKEFKEYDLVIVENQIESLINYKKNIKSKIVEHLHNDYLNINTKYANSIVKTCDEFWGVSNFISKQIKKIDCNTKTRVLYNGVDLKKYSSHISNIEKEKILKKIGFSNNDYIIIYVGRIMPEKGVLQLIEAFNSIKISKKNLKLVIVGAKMNDSKKIQDYYQLITNEKEKNSNNICLYGKADFEELKVLYSISSLQVVPSIWEEAFGLISVEGIISGHPVIVSDSGGLTEIVKNRELIVSKNNLVSELSKKIEEFYLHKYDYINIDELKENIKKFDIDIYCKNFYKYIKEIINKNGD